MSRKSGQGYEGTVECQGRYKKPRVNLERGVSFQEEKDGRGRVYAMFTASIQHAGVVRRAKFSVAKYGFNQARSMAQEIRKRWLAELVGNSSPIVSLSGPFNPPGSFRRLTNNRECLFAITDSLNASGQILGMLNHAICNPRIKIPEIADIVCRDVILTARLIRMANSAFYVRTTSVCKTIEDALQRFGLREIARLVATVSMQDMAPPMLRAYGITGEQYTQSVLFTASASQFIAAELKMDPTVAYLSGLMRPLGILVLNKWAEQQAELVDKLYWGDAASLHQWETNSFGLNHIEVSSFMTRKWGFPAAVSDSIEKSSGSLACCNAEPMALILQTAESLAETNRATFHAQQAESTLCQDRFDALGIKSGKLIGISRDALQQSCDFKCLDAFGG